MSDPPVYGLGMPSQSNGSVTNASSVKTGWMDRNYGVAPHFPDFFLFRLFRYSSTAMLTILERSRTLWGSFSTISLIAASWSLRSLTLTAFFAISGTDHWRQAVHAGGNVFVQRLHNQVTPLFAALGETNKEVEIPHLILRHSETRFLSADGLCSSWCFHFAPRCNAMRYGMQAIIFGLNAIFLLTPAPQCTTMHHTPEEK